VGLRSKIHALIDEIPDDRLEEVRHHLEVVHAGENGAISPEEGSFLERAKDFIGVAHGGPPDLSSNPEYLSGFGE